MDTDSARAPSGQALVAALPEPVPVSALPGDDPSREVEAATAAAYLAIYGDGMDPFEHAEGWEYAGTIATAVIAALTRKSAGEAEACVRCAVLEDLLETATSERDKARDESNKADDEALAHKVRNISKLGCDMMDAYGVIKQFERRAEAAEACLAAFTQQDESE